MTDELDLRASDAERERVAVALCEHCTAGGFALFGGIDEHGADTPPRPGSPLVRVRSLALLGGADVWRVPPDTRAELSPGGTGS